MFVINTAALLILGLLLLRKMVLMDRFFEARVLLLSWVLSVLVLILFCLSLTVNEYDCVTPPGSHDGERFFLCSEM